MISTEKERGLETLFYRIGEGERHRQRERERERETERQRQTDRQTDFRTIRSRGIINFTVCHPAPGGPVNSGGNTYTDAGPISP